MPSFTVEHQTTLNVNDTFTKVCEYFEKSEGLKKLDGDLKFSFDQNTKTGHVKGSKFECSLQVLEESKTRVVLKISIPLLFSPFKGSIESSLKEKMAKILG